VTVLVEDAPGLLVRPRIGDDALQARKLEERRPRHGWKILQQVHRHADRVAAEDAMKQAV
jgi:hypothetical protein